MNRTDGPGRPEIEGDRFANWYAALETRHTADLTFSEIRRAVQALSRGYVEHREGRMESALATAGKRAAFALFYGPLHFLLVRNIVAGIGADRRPLDTIVDLGCGTGVAGAAWAIATGAALRGIERHPWAVDEARWTYRALGLRGVVRSADLDRAALPGKGSGVIVAFTANELDAGGRNRLGAKLLDAASRGAAVLLVEPIARRLTPWWEDWATAFRAAGGDARDWRFPAELPESLRLMDKAAGLDHRELTGRSLWLPGRK